MKEISLYALLGHYIGVNLKLHLRSQHAEWAFLWYTCFNMIFEFLQGF